MSTQDIKIKVWNELSKLHTSNKNAFEEAKFSENKGARAPYFAAQSEFYDYIQRVIAPDTVPSSLPHNYFKQLIHNAELLEVQGTNDVAKAHFNEGFLVAAKTVDRLIEKEKYFS